MMQSKLIAALRIFLILSFLQKDCRGIQCYQCNSNVDDNCNINSVDPKYLRPCPNIYGYCRKSDSIYYFTSSRDYITIRECAMLRTDGKDCYRGRYSKDSYQRVCECKDSGCNRSTHPAEENLRIVIVSLLVIKLFCTRV